MGRPVAPRKQAIIAQHLPQESGSAPRQGPARALVQVFPQFRGRVSPPRLRRLALAALAVGTAPGAPMAGSRPLALGVVIADDETVHDLNHRYRGLDETTDVLSFSPVHAGPYEGEVEPPPTPEIAFPRADGQEEELGEVVVAFPQAERQAGQGGRSTADEVDLLVVHGVLHLLGHDHAETDQEQAMRELERAALDRVGPGR